MAIIGSFPTRYTEELTFARKYRSGRGRAVQAILRVHQQFSQEVLVFDVFVCRSRIPVSGTGNIDIHDTVDLAGPGREDDDSVR